MEKIMHESKILIRTTEKLLEEITREAKNIGWEPIIEKVEKTEKDMKDFLILIEGQLRRAKIDTHQMVQKLAA